MVRWVTPHTGARDTAGRLVAFKDAPAHFRPNLTPHQMLLKGMHGGIYFNPIGGKPGVKYPRKAFPKGIPGVGVSEFPKEWFEGVPKQLYLSRRYSTSHNAYRVKSGLDQAGWESSGWIRDCDPRGWTQWYFRFYQGRRLDDGEDERQISRWSGVAGEKGRWKSNLIAKVLASGSTCDDASVSPVVRQTLLHWAYELCEADFTKGAKRVRSKGAAYVPRELLSGVLTSDAKARGASSGQWKQEDTAAAAQAQATLAAAQADDRARRAQKRGHTDTSASSSAAKSADEPTVEPAQKRKRRQGASSSSRGKGKEEVEVLSTYEIERQQTVARNKAKLAELGLA